MREIDLDELLHGKPSWDEVAAFFKNGEFYEEGYLTSAIKKHLLTEEQRQKLFDCGLSIEDCLNGRYTGENYTSIMSVYDEWNEKLGFQNFKS